MDAKKKAEDFVSLDSATGQAIITLSKPLDLSGAKVATLAMREPTVADQLAQDLMTGGDAAKEIGTIANLCGVTPKDIHALTLRDYRRCQAAYLGFID